MIAAGPRFALALAAVAIAAGCASTNVDPACREQVVERLYFGSAMPGGEVAASEWDAFVDAEVTPRFPEGFTVYVARGQWRGAGEIVQRESTRVVEIVHAGTAAEESKLVEIAARYRNRFRQESVLRTSARVRACF